MKTTTNSSGGAVATRRTVMAGVVAAGLAGLAPPVQAATASQLAAMSRETLARLYAAKPKMLDIAHQAKAVLVFPEIVKAGLMVGGQGGEGAMLINDQVVGFYQLAAASFGFQAGAQKFAYALFFMTDSALDYLRKSDGWSVGSGPSLTVIDEGYANAINTTTLKKDIYAIGFGQKGLMAGLGLEGSKITPIHPPA